MSEYLDGILPNFNTVDEAVKTYIERRDALREFQHDAKWREMEMKEELERISMWLRDKADALGVDNFKTPHGTAYRNTKTNYVIEDWESFIQYILNTGYVQLLQKRVSVAAARELEEELKEIPLGLTKEIEVEFNVLRPKARKGE